MSMLPFSDGLASARSPAALANVFSLPKSAPPSTSARPAAAETKKQKTAPPAASHASAESSSSAAAAAAVPPKSRRQLKEEAKREAWNAHIAAKEANQRAAAEREGRLPEFEKDLAAHKEEAAKHQGPRKTNGGKVKKAERGANGSPSGQEEIAFLQAKKRARGDGDADGGDGDKREGKKNKKRKKEKKAEGAAGHVPLLNGAPASTSFRKSSIAPVSETGNEQPSPPLGKASKNPKPAKSAVGSSLPTPSMSKSPAEGMPSSHNAQLRAKANTLRRSREDLPIWPHRDALRQCLLDRDVLVMLGETGSGKSTQIGQFLLHEPWMRASKHGPGCIAITQPRRVAATNLARRVAAEMGVKLGEEVGYSVRFDNKSDPSTTRIKFLTDGMLLQELLHDPLLRRYKCVVVDEAHERTVGTDLVMGFLRQLVYGPRRGTLKVVVMSATLEVERMMTFFEEHNCTGELERLKMAEAQQEKEPEKPPIEAKQNGEIKQNGDLEALHEEALKEKPSKAERKKLKKEKKRREKMTLDERIKALDDEDAGISSQDAATTTPDLTTPPPEVNGTDGTENDQAGNFEDNYFGTVAIYQVPGRQHPVEIFHASEPVQDYLDAALRTIYTIHFREPLPGDVLVFLTGQEEIETLQKLIEGYAPGIEKGVPQVMVLPLYASLPPHLQNRIFEPVPGSRPTRKIILATNIAETSLTVPGVRYIVDTGFSKQKQYRPAASLESLLVTPISRSAASQRAGRAGREAPGKCYRLYTEKDFEALPAATPPEILRADLASALLTLKSRKVDDVTKFPFMAPPPREALAKALETLVFLGALDLKSSHVAPLGRQMASLPLTPTLARVLLAAAEPALDVLPEAIDIVAALSVENLFTIPVGDEAREKMDEAQAEFRRGEGDHLMLLMVVRTYLEARESGEGAGKRWCDARWVNNRAMAQLIAVRKQLREVCARMKMGGDVEVGDGEEVVTPEVAERVLKSFLRGFFANTARLTPGGEYRTVMSGGMGNSVTIHPSSCLFGGGREGAGGGKVRAEAIMYHEYVYTTRPFARWCSKVQMDWVEEAMPRLVGVAV